MRSSKIIFGLALIAFCCFSVGLSIKCYTCTDVKSCKKPKLYECTPALANQTRLYVDFHHVGVNLNQTSRSFDCFREELKVSSGTFHHRGCLYDNIRGCSLALRPHHLANKNERKCNQCNNKDGCNPAGRAAINLMTVVGAIFVGLIVRFVW